MMDGKGIPSMEASRGDRHSFLGGALSLICYSRVVSREERCQMKTWKISSQIRMIWKRKMMRRKQRSGRITRRRERSTQRKDLTDIYLLRSYIHLRYVDVSENHLTDLSPLNYLTHLLWLKADGNNLRSAQLNELPYLQVASFAYNQITDTEGISHPRLGSLDLKGNRIRRVTGLDPQKLLSLHTLELRGNQLESTLGINLPKLKNLYLAQNMLKKVEGLENLSNLTTLHLRDNQIETLSGFSKEMASLQYLNLRGNMVTHLEELAKLRDLPKLRALVLLDNPCTDEADYRQEALVQIAHLERLDKDFYEEEERADADEIRQRLKETQEQEAEEI
ncbi:leucine-rich repeat-containing protein 23 isoform X3 [Vulpes vulpes]|uniref:Leucine-rich repeat-containing protein 23 isoform X3 n=1 Tax=Vulpes vulpes TaxID=9627 RepID=A0ABM5B593_VULVU